VKLCNYYQAYSNDILIRSIPKEDLFDSEKEKQMYLETLPIKYIH